MGIKVDLGHSESQAASVTRMLEEMSQVLRKSKHSISMYTQDVSMLKGKAYEASRAYQTEVILPAISFANDYYKELQLALKKLPSDYQTMVDSKSWSEEELQELIDSERRSIHLLQNQIHHVNILKGVKTESKRSILDSLNRSMDLHDSNVRQYEDLLEKLRVFDTYSASVFDGVNELKGIVREALSLAKSSWNAQASHYSSTDKMLLLLAKAKTISDKNFIEDYGLSRPKGMSDKDYSVYVGEVKQQVATLLKDGWSKKAIKEGYIATVNVAYDSNKEMSIEDQLGEYFDDAHTVGSTLFNNMITVAYKDTKEGQQKTLDMVYKILGAEVDKNGFLQMTNMKITDSDETGAYQFTTNMDDALTFDDTFSSIVQDVYPKGLPIEAKEGSKAFLRAQETHQFRYYMDKKNNDALRATYPDEANDLERIKRYNGDNPSSKFTGEKARLHNKYQGDPEDYPKHIEQYGENFKYVTPSAKKGFHSEFIINDKTKHLVSQWYAYEFDENGNVNSDPNKVYTKEEQMQLVDGNSVNYAESSGRGDYHTQYDSDPVSIYDPEVRKEVRKGWNSPKTDNELEDYYDIENSVKEANSKVE
ncbi:DUF3114 domain-containing protein [Streptococcus pluranimalium]|uniref:DUF3114 domain-containing protein n=1 Tax=Streptococcus pluranimalium TaxID=82348 RepID=UPI0034651E75